MAGYSGYSKSNNAISAEKNGMMNATQIVSYLRDKKLLTGITTKIIKEVLPKREWHHTSKHYNITNYYDLDTVFEYECELKAAIAASKKVKKIKHFWFKCWNTDRDVRSWDWKITDRFGNNCFSFDEANKLIEKEKRLSVERFETSKKGAAQIRIFNESTAVIKKIEEILKIK